MAVLKSPGLVVVWPKHPQPWWETKFIDEQGRDLAAVILTATFNLLPGYKPTVLLKMLVNEHGQPMADHGPTLLSSDGSGYRTGVFEYTVLEMRVAEEK